jgi:hypothetical protein
MVENRGWKIILQDQISKIVLFSTKTFVAIQMNKEYVLYDKSLYGGFTILDLSKNYYLRFCYTFLKRKYEDKVNRLYTDTDSLIIETLCDNFYDDIKENFILFNTSNYDGTRNPLIVNTQLCSKWIRIMSGSMNQVQLHFTRRHITQQEISRLFITQFYEKTTHNATRNLSIVDHTIL